MTLSERVTGGPDVTAPWWSVLRCPRCRGPLQQGGSLRCDVCRASYPVDGGIPRFVPRADYAEGFGYRWNRRRLEQLDSRSGQPINRDLLLNQSGWSTADLRGGTVLEYGGGAGRFTEVLCETGALVTSVEPTSAVHANAASNGHFPNLRLVRAGLGELPLPEESFDFVFCRGVVHHCGDAEAAFKTLFRYLRPGGRFCVDVRAAAVTRTHPLRPLRPITRHLPPAVLYGLVERAVPKLLALRAIPGLDHLDGETARSWAVVTTFEWLSPRHLRPQPRRRLERWTRDLALREVAIDRHFGVYVIRGTK
ncbi:SAM-dependent methyltransferase [Planotetraspora sp. GP83]